MKRSINIVVIFGLLLLFSGGALFMLLNRNMSQAETVTSFQSWLWDKRGLDLIVQVLLVFSGALGIAAILPDEENQDG
jgi:multisubunit Na+/H+ antiporter MnhB subunit